MIGLLYCSPTVNFFRLPPISGMWRAYSVIACFSISLQSKGNRINHPVRGFQFQPAEFCKICVALALAKYLSRPETDFSKTRSQLIAAGIVLFPAALTIMQKETGLALVFFAFFLVMYREGLPSAVLDHWFCSGCIGGGNIIIGKKYTGLDTYRHRFIGCLFHAPADKTR